MTGADRPEQVPTRLETDLAPNPIRPGGRWCEVTDDEKRHQYYCSREWDLLKQVVMSSFFNR
jgi:hypothetical protein